MLAFNAKKKLVNTPLRNLACTRVPFFIGDVLANVPVGGGNKKILTIAFVRSLDKDRGERRLLEDPGKYHSVENSDDEYAKNNTSHYQPCLFYQVFRFCFLAEYTV